MKCFILGLCSLAFSIAVGFCVGAIEKLGWVIVLTEHLAVNVMKPIASHQGTVARGTGET